MSIHKIGCVPNPSNSNLTWGPPSQRAAMHTMPPYIYIFILAFSNVREEGSFWSAMVSKVSSPKFKYSSYFSLFSLSFFLLLIYAQWLHQLQGPIHPQNHPIKRSEPFDLLSREFNGKPINISLVNVDEEGDDHSIKWHDLGRATAVRFDRVSRAVRWEDFFPEWIDEDERDRIPKCPTIPMPRFEDYGEMDAVVARAPCGGGEDGRRGIRDVFRLQVHLVVANLVVRSGWRENDRTVVVVFVGSCGPMWEIFRCEDLVRRQGDVWVYRPDLRRLKQKLLMPIGSCQLALPILKQGELICCILDNKNHF